MTITITERYMLHGLYSVQEESVQRYSVHSDRRAFNPYSGLIIVLSPNGQQTYRREGCHSLEDFYASLVKKFDQEGVEVSLELRNFVQQNAKWKEAERNQRLEHEKKCYQEARETGKPVVIWHLAYDTTASVGTHYRIALPNGKSHVVTIGNSRAGHSLEYKSTDNSSSVMEAIARYNNRT